VDMYNFEHYPDPTAAEAMANVEREEKAKAKQYRPLVYVCSPYAGDTKRNIARAQEYCRFVVSEERIPLAPHLLYPQFMDDSDREQRELGLSFALILLCKCDEVWVFGSHISNGMEREIAKANYRGITVRYFTYKCEVVKNEA
jgi:hypothetical protein